MSALCTVRYEVDSVLANGDVLLLRRSLLINLNNCLINHMKEGCHCVLTVVHSMNCMYMLLRINATASTKPVNIIQICGMNMYLVLTY